MAEKAGCSYKILCFQVINGKRSVRFGEVIDKVLAESQYVEED